MASADELMAKYGRSKAYNSSNWDTVGGSLSDATYLKFKALADAKYPDYLSKKTLQLSNGDVIDLPHFWATISAQINGYGNLGGWAGDLIQLAGDIATGATATFPSGRFGKEDWVSDADAYNLQQMGGYVNNLANYWSTITEKTRVAKFTASHSNIKSWYDSITSSWTGKESWALTLLETQEGATSSSLKQAANAMQSYLDGVKNS